MQHYFVSAWLPPEGVAARLRDRKAPGRHLRRAADVPGQRRAGRVGASSSAPLYAGPQEQRRLRAAAPGLDLVVDYGWLAIIAWPLFWLLEKFHALSGNWGVAIILLTVLIKLRLLPAVGGELQVDGEDEAGHAAPHQAPRACTRTTARR